ncbi:hypothetical protein FNV43_RR22285 [Rhamnella rubrinervis]|uniref:Uncharacterized protein n=1 Tax=Rhamnella rubrinervis TaxID=2594499 RepID=A0A8K0DVW8_9ROSA|nr:hypothetical protein FNV43_RR22285 [Rhamnella rubrinervis]
MVIRAPGFLTLRIQKKVKYFFEETKGDIAELKRKLFVDFYTESLKLYLKKMHGLWRMRSAKFQSLIRPRFSSSRMTQWAFLCKVFFCQANLVFECFTNPPDNREKPVAPLPASFSPSLLDSKRLKAISRVSEIGSSGKLRPQVLYLIELGMDLDQIKRTTRRYPLFPFQSLEGKIKPLVEFLLHLGVPKSGIPSILNRRPQFCGISLSENIIPTMAFLESLGVNKKQWAKVIYCSPAFLTFSRQKVKSTVDFLGEMGLSAESIGKILTRFPQIVGYSVENKLRPTAEYFHSLGVDIAVLLHRFPQNLSFSVEANMKPVTEFFLERGFSMEEVGTMISRFAPLYGLSLEKNLIPKWEFFLTMGYPRSELVKHPAYFAYSLEKRIKPRVCCQKWESLLTMDYPTSELIKARYALMKECGVVLPLGRFLALSSGDFDKALKKKLKEKQESTPTCVFDIFTADSGISGSFSLEVVEGFPNPPDNKESEIGSSGKLRPHVLYLIEHGLE